MKEEEMAAGSVSGDTPGQSLSARYFNDLLEATEHLVYRLDLVRGGYDFISPAAALVLGAELDELRLRGQEVLRDRLNPDDRAQSRILLGDLCRAAPGQHIRTRIEYRLRDASGAWEWYGDSMRLESDSAGRLAAVYGIAVDITARRQKEIALRESEEKYRATMSSAQVGIFVLQDYKFRYANPKLLAMFGYREEEIVGRLGPPDLVCPADRDTVLDRMKRRVAGEAGVPYEMTGLRKDGSTFPLMIFGQPSTLDGHPASVGTLIDLTAQRHAEQELKDTTNRYAALFEGAQDAILVADVGTGVVVDANVEAELLFMRPRGALVGLHFSSVYPPTSTERYEAAFLRHVSAGGGGPEEMQIATLDGSIIAVEVSTNVIETAGGHRLIQGVFRDIRQRKKAEAELKLAARVFESSPEAIVITDAENNIVSVNPAFSEMTGYGADEVIGQSPRLLSSGRQSAEFYTAMWQAIIGEGKWQGELWNRRKNGDVFPAWLTISAYRDAAGQIINYVGIEIDISEQHAAQERIRQLAYYDPLTGLPNRTLLQDRVGQVLAAAERDGRQAAVLFIDLDHFKKINDSLGHSAGDQMLVQVAQRLLDCLRRMDTVARLGGDEFVVLLSDVTLAGATDVARKILASVAGPYLIDGHELSVTPSLGISLFPQDGRDFESLLKHADTAMYLAKESGRNAYQFFASEMNVVALERLVLENSLRQGLERGEFVLHYQPQVNANTGRIVGAEALIRWRHPELGMVSPAKFIPVAEASGLIVSIGEWVLREACRQNRAWQLAGLTPICVAVNISAAQFRDGRLEESVRAVLAETGIAPGCLELELTESTVMSDADATVEMLRRLSAMGVKLAIDDFGTGYSSLSYLKRFPIDKLKIDQSFVRDIVTDPDDWAIATAVISMGHSLRLAVIAEGVERAEQLQMLRRQGCDEVQGYYFSVPLPAAEFAVLLQQQKFEIGA